MSQPADAPENKSARSRWLLLGGVAAAAAVATVVGIGINGSEDDQAPSADLKPTDLPSLSVTELSAGPAIAAKCAAPTSADAKKQSVAFEGIVTEVQDGTVTLAPTHFYNGEETATVVIAAPDQGMSEAPAEFVVGGSYIVGANDGRVAICGLTGPADDDLRALYEGAFGR